METVAPSGAAPPPPVARSDLMEKYKERLQNLKANRTYEKRMRAASPGKPCPMVRMWLIDTGCGHDLVSHADTVAMKRFIEKAAQPLTFHTANGDTEAHEVVNSFMAEIREEIKPYILESTPNVLSVGFRCVKLGYSVIWPAGERPYFVLPSGQIVELDVIDDIPYLMPGAAKSLPRKQKGPRCFACGAKALQVAGVGSRSATAVARPAAPADSAAQNDPEEMVSSEEAEKHLPPNVCRDLRAEASSLAHLLTHRPKNPYCQACARGKCRRVVAFAVLSRVRPNDGVPI